MLKHHPLMLLFIFLCLAGAMGKQLSYSDLGGKPYAVTYDHRSYMINSSRVLLLSGSVHYPRSTPAMWPVIFDLAVKNGLNAIETYVFWNIHEAERGVYDFSDRADLLQFIEQAAAKNLFVILRIGPYVCAEWHYGGFPLWLRDLPGIEFRTYNQPFVNEMARFVTDIANMVRPYLPSQGGNIIISQIENEYNQGNTAADEEYVRWCGDFAQSLDLGVPWIMCNGQWANNTIDTCNSCFCDSWVPQHWQDQPDTPPGWTENEGWFDQWGNSRLYRLPNELAYSVARYVAVGGAFHNYYMWHGGNNYGITAGACVTTSYANDVHLDSMALPHEPKYSFLGELHFLLAKYSDVLLGMNPPNTVGLAPTVDFLDYGTISFLSNNGTSPVVATLEGKTYYLPYLSVVIFDQNKNVLYNTSDVSTEDVPHQITPTATSLAWSSYAEPTGVSLKTAINNPTPLEHLILSQDKTDYVWYSTFTTLPNVSDVRIVSGQAHAYSIFVDGKYLGSNWDTTKTCCDPINISITLSGPVTSGKHQIDILSTSLGIDNVGAAMQDFVKGIIGDVFFGSANITQPPGSWWTMQQGLYGEELEIYSPDNLNLVTWSPTLSNAPATWHYAKFTKPTAQGTVALDMTGAGKGLAYINGNCIGRYWSIIGNNCNVEVYSCFLYKNSTCHEPLQSLYHIPPDWLVEGDNYVVLFEELGAPDISSVQVVVVS